MSVSPTENENTNQAEFSDSASEGSNAGSPPANEGVNAESPTADKGAKETLVDRIKKATDSVTTEQSPGSESGEGSETNASAPQGETEEEVKPFTKDDLPHLHSKTRKRVEKLLATVDSVTHERDTLKPAAEAYQGVMGFLKSNGLSMDDANKAFDIMRDIQHNPEQALKQLQPIVQQLMQLTGDILPDDLAQRVNQGYLSEADAREIALHRVNAVRQQEREKDQETENQHKQREAALQNVNSIQNAVSKWESSWASSDPDYKIKRDEVRDLIELELARSQRAKSLPKTSEDAVKLAEKCRAIVEKKLGKFQPRKTEVVHVSGSSAPGSRPPVKTLEDAILQRVNG